MKRIITSIVLAITLCAAVATSVFAADEAKILENVTVQIPETDVVFTTVGRSSSALEQPPAATIAGGVAKPMASAVLVNGENKSFDAYTINGSNYFKLRDLAYVLNGTEKQFEVGYDAATKAVTLTSGQAYTAVGGEMTGKGAGNRTPAATSSKLTCDGQTMTFTAYNIEGNNYFRLRDIGEALDFGVTWDSAKNTVVIDTSKGYTESWGPQDRPIFYPDNPAPYPVFNSMLIDQNAPENQDNHIINTIGNEHNFVKIKEYETDEPYTDEVTLEIGKEYEVYIYYHNNASSTLNKVDDDGDGWPDGLARDVRLRSQMPSKLQKGQTAVVTATISSINTTPKEVWDSAYMYADDTVNIRYVTGSTVIHNQGAANGHFLNGDNMFSEQGTYLGHKDILPNDGKDEISWGIIPGGSEYAGYVTYRIKVDQPKFMLTKEVSRDAENIWSETIDAKTGDILDFKIRYTNIGTTNQEKVSMFDKLPVGLKYIAGTTFFAVDGKEGKFVEGSLFNGGLNIGAYMPGTGAILTYKAQVVGEDGTIPLLNEASVVTENGTMYDSVKININVDSDI